MVRKKQKIEDELSTIGAYTDNVHFERAKDLSLENAGDELDIKMKKSSQEIPAGRSSTGSKDPSFRLNFKGQSQP